MTIYADVLLVTNLFVNYALLDCSARIMKNPASRLRLLLGAGLGSIYGLVIFLPAIPNVLEFFMRIFASVLIVLSTFGFINMRKFLRCFFTFFAVSMGFGGIMLFLWVTVAPEGMIYNNGTVYFDISLVTLAISTVVCFALVSLIAFFVERKAPKTSTATVIIGMDGACVKLNALIDTGNSLRESFSGYPVAVAEKSEIQKILPDCVSDYLNGNAEQTTAENFRLIVHTTVAGTGLMPAFKPDYVEIKTAAKSIRTDKVYIGVTKNNIAAGEYGIILNPALLDGEKTYAEII